MFVAVGGGLVQWRLPDGTLNATLDTGLHGYGGDYTTGMAFDKLGNLYVTNFSAGAVTRFDTNGNRLGTFGTGYNSAPESIVFDAAGDAFVGQASGSWDVLRFDGGGQPRATYDVPTGPIGSDWIDLSVDQCTLLYTSEGPSIRRFNVCTNTPMNDLTGLLNQAFALRILPGERAVLVADRTAIQMVDGITGGLFQAYDAPGQDCWFALNLDPDGSSFWTADFCSSMVYKFDIASGAVLASFSTGTPTQTVYGLVVNGEFSQARNRDCSSENLALGQVGSAGDQVVVRYDPRYLVDESLANYTTQAQAMAEQIRSRAVATLAEYRDQLLFAVPDRVTIEIHCQIPVLSGQEPPGRTEGEDLVKLRADYVRDKMLDPTNTDPNATWKTLVDHELYHAIQFKALGPILPVPDQILRYFIFGDATNAESGAQLAQDLIAESDDAPVRDASYLTTVNDWFAAPSTIDAGWDDGDGNFKYRAAGFVQYLGERFGSGATLEPRVAEFMRRLLSATGLGAIEDALGSGDSSHDTTFDRLRDFYVTALVHSAANAWQYPNYRILDEITAHGGAAGTPQAYPSLTVPNANTRALAAAQFLGQRLQHAQGAVYIVNDLQGVSTVRVTLTTRYSGFPIGARMRTAFIPRAADGSVLVDSRYMPDGPVLATDSWVVPVAGQADLPIVLVASQTSADFDLTVEDAGGTSAVDLLRPTAANPAPPLESACPNTYLPITVRPTVNGAFDDGLASVAFTATLDGTSVPVTSAFEVGDSYIVYLRPGTKPSVGDHTIRVSFNGVIAPQIGQISVVESTTCSTDRERTRSASLGTLAQGGQAGAVVPVAAGDTAVTFGLTWSGSDFDLQLTSPSGRIVDETTVAGDVHVVQGASSVEITIDNPEAGAWTVQATGVDVPTPEPVTYDVTETGTAVRSEVSATAQGTAGDPIAVRLALTDDSVGLVGAAVEATITDPAGITRHFPLVDDGAHGDTSPNDGVYGTLAWATEMTGSYHLVVNATGTRADGAGVEREEETDVVLGSKVDTDGDGVANVSEALFGLAPADPSDGSVDFDGDGLGLAAELAAGLDPFSWDTDGGGEGDSSELAAGRDPRRSGDDHAFPLVFLSALAQDGNLVSVSSVTSDQTGQIQLYRFSGTSRTDLGLRPGTDSTFVDGPLPSGTYRYAAVAVAADGAQSAPQFGPPVTVAADVTAPFVRISANDGVWATDNRDARIVFTDLSEPVTEMRLAESEADLAAAPWTPYANPTIFTINPALGRHFLLAQVRDAAGNVSNVASAVVDLVDNTPPVSQAGPLAEGYSSDAVDVPFAASDDLSGVASVELWSRYRAASGDPWSAWTLGPTGPASPITYTFGADGFYEFYTIATDVSGNRELAPASADATTQRLSSDTTAPISQAGPLDSSYATNTVSVPFSASDTGGSGVASVELLVRYRVNEAQAWGSWSMALTGVASPFSYTFANGDGNYEFYTIAVDNAGNREVAPSVADAATRRDAVDDPPDFTENLYATGPPLCPDPLCVGVTTANGVVLAGSGTAVDDRSTLAVSWRLYGVNIGGSPRPLIKQFKPATPSDGNFDTRLEGFSISDNRPDQGYTYYDVEIKVVAGTKSTVRTIRLQIDRSTN